MTTSRITQGSRTLLFLLAAIPLGALGVTVLVAGWILTIVLSITPLVVPVLAGFRATVGGIARVEGGLANALLRTRVRPPVTSPSVSGFWARAGSVLGDTSFWKQQVYLMQRFVLGGTLAVAEVTLIGAALGAITMPIYYRWSNTELGSYHVDTLGRALLWVVPGLLGLALGIYLLRPLTAMSRSLAESLLGGRADGVPAPPSARRRALTLHAYAFAALNGLMILIWALTSHGYFWPMWILLPTGLALGIHAWVELVDARPELVVRGKRATRGLAIHEGVAIAIGAFLTLIWAVTWRGYFWPMWPLIALAVIYAVHLGVAFVRRGDRRIAELETTRAAAVDQQEVELRRIERDLHDGAQARLVSLGMSIGMAEQKLATDPAAAQELLADARRGAQEALVELRDLARGIHPPVLTDRGLEAAVAALADRSPLRVNVTVDLPARPAPPVETAAYFVVAESLANAGKHAEAGRVDISVTRDGDALVVQVVDDGQGGADPNGNGLRGLARRVEALDGTLAVTSPPGGPTTVRAVMPCGS